MRCDRDALFMCHTAPCVERFSSFRTIPTPLFFSRDNATATAVTPAAAAKAAAPGFGVATKAAARASRGRLERRLRWLGRISAGAAAAAVMRMLNLHRLFGFVFIWVLSYGCAP